MILDSSYLFDLMADDPDAFSKGVELVDRGEMQRLPTPVVAEAYYGVSTVRSTATPTGEDCSGTERGRGCRPTAGRPEAEGGALPGGGRVSTYVDR